MSTRTSAASICRKARGVAFVNQGFTLIELVVVMVILAIVAGLLALTLSSNEHRLLRTEAKRFQHAAKLASDLALLTGVDHGIELAGDGYRVLAFDAITQQWLPADQLQPRSLPEPIAIELMIEKRVVDIEDAQDLEEHGRTPNPQVVFWATGEAVEFVVHFRLRDAERVISVAQVANDIQVGPFIAAGGG